jgi:iron complex transport system substrate-binding protein
MNTTRRRFLAGLSVLAVAPVLAACGSDSETASQAPTGASDAPEEAAFPATITHKFGETTIETAPQRVVCVGLLEQDALLALGVVPVATTKWFGDAPGAIFPWATDKLGDADLPTVLDSTNGIDVEKVASLAPDLIIGQYAGITQKEYDLLSKIAPTVAQSGEYVDYGMPWDESTVNIGTAIGKPKAAQQLVDDVNARIRKEADAHPEFAGNQAAVVTPYEGLWVYGPQDPRSRMLGQLGFEFPSAIEDKGADEFGYSLSAERTADLDGLDVVVWLDVASADKGMSELWEKTTAYAEGRWFDISDADGAYYVAQSMVTPLSIPYTLDRYVPQLAAAVDGDPRTKPPVVKD